MWNLQKLLNYYSFSNLASFKSVAIPFRVVFMDLLQMRKIGRVNYARFLKSGHKYFIRRVNHVECVMHLSKGAQLFAMLLYYSYSATAVLNSQNTSRVTSGQRTQ